MIIKQLGFYAHWVDAGRKHAQINGYAQLGALDSISFQLANAMCGNALLHPAIELMGGNISILIEQACVVCITGALVDVRVNERAVSLNEALAIKAGEVLHIANLKAGWVNYIACSLSFSLPVYYSSVSGSKREKIGGTHQNGNGLAVGDSFAIDQTISVEYEVRDVVLSCNQIPPILQVFSEAIHFRNHHATNAVNLPVHFCYQADYFSHEQQALFLASEYTITHEADRMGLRLSGHALNCSKRTLTSQPIALGAIQIAGNGQAIIMRNDRQTIGGYPIIGTVSKLGLAVLAQCTSGQRIQFIAQSIATSVMQSTLHQQALNSVRNKALT